MTTIHDVRCISSITISPGNSKIGDIPNISLIPWHSCRKDIPCFKKCYARRIYQMQPSCRISWTRNLEAYLFNPQKFFADIDHYFKLNSPRFFRWHVAGDFPDQNYFNQVIRLARKYPKVKFLAFTKRFDLRFRAVPSNFKLIISAWPNYDVPANLQKRFKVAWMQDGTETRIPKTAIRCSGDCQNCLTCWSSSKRHVYFKLHK